VRLVDHQCIQDALDEALNGRRLLEHPFYRRWEAGELGDGELAAYASQYRHFEAKLPGFLSDVASGLVDGPARRAVEANLADELGDPVSHLELFDRFAGAIDAPEAPPSPATAALLEAYDAARDAGPVRALAGLLAYEYQSPEVASSKAAGLRNHFGLDGAAVAFWDHHGVVDSDHARWTMDALIALGSEPSEISTGIRPIAEAWWAFLDERETEGLAA
jgi:pyrroloquinoline-quinone synthase